MGDVVDFSRKVVEGGGNLGYAACECGSGWWKVIGMCMEADGKPSGYTGIPTCYDCGKPYGGA